MVSSTNCLVETYLKVLVKPYINFLYIVGNIYGEMSFKLCDELVLPAYLARCANVVAYMEMYINTTTMHKNLQIGYEWVQYILNENKRKCRNVFRLSNHLFGELCNTLRT